MQIRITLTLQRIIDVNGEIDSITDEWPEDYQKKLNRIIRQLERQGWSVDFETAEEE